MSTIKLTIERIFNDRKLLLAFVFFLSLLASLLFLVFLGYVGPSDHNIPGSDYLNFYEPVANNILQGNGIVKNGELAMRYPPGFPVVLAFIFGLANFFGLGNLGLVIVFNSLMMAGTACLLFLTAEYIFNRKIALISSLLWLSYPFNLWFVKNPNSEVPFILLIFAGIWFYLLALNRKSFGFIFLSGLLLGFAALVRPIGFLLPFLLAILVFFLLKESSKKTAFLLALLMVASSILAILPWEAYVFSETGSILPLSTGGPVSIVDGLAFAAKAGDGGDVAKVPTDVLSLMERAREIYPVTYSEISSFILIEIVEKPMTFLKLVGLKLIRSFYATSQMWWEGKILLVQLCYLLTGIFGIGLAFKNHKDKVREIILILAVILFFWGMTFMVLSMLRYMVPVMGFVMIFSALSLVAIMDKCFKKS